jgi:hypothetical protein
MFLILAIMWLGVCPGLSLTDGEAISFAQFIPKRKPYDRGNCFHWQGCKGESIGAMWVHAPEFCAALGGRSWIDESTGLCHNIPPGPRGLLGL